MQSLYNSTTHLKNAFCTPFFNDFHCILLLFTVWFTWLIDVYGMIANEIIIVVSHIAIYYLSTHSWASYGRLKSRHTTCMFLKVCGTTFLTFNMLFNPTSFIDLRTCRIVGESVTSILMFVAFERPKSYTRIPWHQVYGIKYPRGGLSGQRFFCLLYLW